MKLARILRFPHEVAAILFFATCAGEAAHPQPKSLLERNKIEIHTDQKQEFQPYTNDKRMLTKRISVRSKISTALKETTVRHEVERQFSSFGEGLERAAKIKILTMDSATKNSFFDKSKPYETKTDFTKCIKQHTLLLGTDKSGALVTMDGVNELRLAIAQCKIDNEIKAVGLNLLSPSLLLGLLDIKNGKDTYKALQVVHKVGDKWSDMNAEDGMATKSHVEFKGWTRIGGKKTAVFETTIPTQEGVIDVKKERTESKGPTQVIGSVGGSALLLINEEHETSLHLEMTTHVSTLDQRDSETSHFEVQVSETRL